MESSSYSILCLMDLRNIKRPSIGLVKFVEALGLLLTVPLSYEKSMYKCDIPTNYDATIEKFAVDFESCYNYLMTLRSSDISNLVAREFYMKVKEPGFSYEDVVAESGLMGRDLFNAIMYLLYSLQTDKYRIPLKDSNVFVVVNGSRSSYVALDTAAHVHSSGMLTVVALTSEFDPISNDDITLHLSKDIEQRCQRQYQKASYLYTVDPYYAISAGEALDACLSKTDIYQSNVVVIGIETDLSVSSGLEELAYWGLLTCRGRTVVLVKSSVKIPLFGIKTLQRNFLLAVKHLDDLEYLYEKCVSLMHPLDTLILYAVIQKPSRIEHTWDGNIHSRFEIGRRDGIWVNEKFRKSSVAGEALSEIVSSRGGDPDAYELLTNTMSNMIECGQINGKVRVDYFEGFPRTFGRLLCEVALQEEVDMLCIKRGSKTDDLMLECVKNCNASIAVFD